MSVFAAWNLIFVYFPYSLGEMVANLKSGRHKRYLETIPSEQVIK